MNKNHFLKKWTAKKSLIVILLVQMIAMAFWGNAKKGYFVDELWSYGLANSYYFPHIFSTTDGRADSHAKCDKILYKKLKLYLHEENKVV